jgi:mannose-6-phosphate isomerase-like protein (cupin superfamily)
MAQFPVMIVRKSGSTPADGKGWFAGPWDSTIPVAVGWADRGVDQPHRHDEMTEIYLVARGTSTAVVAGETIHLSAGTMLAVEPGEAHTFISSSADYLHFVVQAPFVAGDKVDLDGAR